MADFRSHLGSIFLLREELQAHCSGAQTSAVSHEELRKLLSALVKIETELTRVKEEIITALTAATPSTHSQPPAVAPPIAEPVVRAPYAAAVAPPIAQPVVRAPYAATVAPSIAEPVVRAPYAATVAPQSALGRRVDYRNSDVPDKQKIFIPHISFNTTENGLAHYFSSYGHVIHARIFSVPARDPSVPVKGNLATVGFEDYRVVEGLLASPGGNQLLLDGVKIMPRAYVSREKYNVNLKQERYQIFIGGVPSHATPEQIGQGLSQHLCEGIIDIRVVYVAKRKGTAHRGFAYVDLESEEDALYLLRHRYVNICGKRAECKVNTCSVDTINRMENRVMLDQYDDDKLVNAQDDFSSGDTSPVGSIRDSLPTVLGSSGANGISLKVTDKCIVCGINPRNCVLLWCCHDETCEECAEKLMVCPKPECREPIAMRETTIKLQK
ncbi:hypothetical protein BV898_17243 [Hypsibius exemplaris]|uniref:RRM domain-containing protein n=1 Tax=Hypsibius exemplaris TaxID=2072580 RepID=A0A9X6NEQ3_HYPEX|nr:hypothetical protein BV898_17243 [Hypsibius exemplaris]